eukprot:1571726-Amphidinium_carterae.1
MEEYNAVLAYFAGKEQHTSQNQIDEIFKQYSQRLRQQKSENEIYDAFHNCQTRQPEMQLQRKTQSIVEEDENDVTDNFDERSTTRASGSTGVKQKMSGDMTDKKKIHPGSTVINMYNPTFHTTSIRSIIYEYIAKNTAYKGRNYYSTVDTKGD